MGLSISSLSTIEVVVPVSATGPSGPVNPTGDVVELAFVPRGNVPAGGDWHAGAWASVTPVNGWYWATVLVGPANSGIVLAEGSYVIWLKVIDAPEVPVTEAGTLTITP